MPDPVLVAVVALAAIAIAVTTWNAAAADEDRAGLFVVLGVAIPALTAMGVLGSGAGPVPVVVAAAGVGALLPGSLRILVRLTRTRTGAAEVSPVETASALAAGLRKAA